MFRCARLIIPVFIGKTKGNAVRQFDNIDVFCSKTTGRPRRTTGYDIMQEREIVRRNVSTKEV